MTTRSKQTAERGIDHSYHHGDLASTLLDAVEDIIIERGIDNVSLREAARRAGVSHSAPAHHFGDKEGLLCAVAERGFANFGRHLAEAYSAGETDDLAERAQRMGAAYVRFAISERAQFEAMFRSGVDKSDPASSIGIASDKCFGSLTRLVTDIKTHGLFPDTEARDLATYLWSVGHGLSTLIIDGVLKKFYEEDTDEIIDGVMGITAARIGSEERP